MALYPAKRSFWIRYCMFIFVFAGGSIYYQLNRGNPPYRILPLGGVYGYVTVTARGNAYINLDLVTDR